LTKKYFVGVDPAYMTLENIYSSSMSLQDFYFISVINAFTDGQKGMTDREKARL